MVTIPPPPRLTGDAASIAATQNEYNFSLYKALVLEGLLAGDAPVFDASDLPDPASTSLAQAQETANQAFIIATAAAVAALANAAALNGLSFVQQGEVTISNTATTGVLTFDEAEADTDYFVLVDVVSSSGAAVDNSYVVKGKAKTTADVTITLLAAPGAGTSVTYSITVLRST